MHRLSTVAVLALVAACSSAAPPPAVPERTITHYPYVHPVATPNPWPDAWQASYCLAHQKAVASFDHLKAAAEALQAYDTDVATTESTQAAADATGMAADLAHTQAWGPGKKAFAALASTGVELRKTAGLIKLYIRSQATDTQVLGEMTKMTTAAAGMAATYTALGATTGFDCPF